MHPNTRSRLSAPSTGVTHVFFDAEGTLWQPRPGRTIHDFWDAPSRARAQAVFDLTPGVEETLQALRERGLTLVVMSKHDPELLPRLLEDFGLADHFADVLVDDDKQARVSAWLDEQGIDPRRAVMVGDRVEYDIEPLAEAGVIGILLDQRYNRGFGHLRIHRLADLLPTIAFLNALRCEEQQVLEQFDGLGDPGGNGSDGPSGSPPSSGTLF